MGPGDLVALRLFLGLDFELLAVFDGCASQSAPGMSCR